MALSASHALTSRDSFFRPRYLNEAPVLSEAEDLPHLREVELCVNADLVHVENKYGAFLSQPHLAFRPQLFSSPLSDRSAAGPGRPGAGRDGEDDDADVEPYLENRDPDDEHYGGPPIMAYEPLFSWETDRAAVIGQRMPIKPIVSSTVGTRFSVRILSFNVPAGLVEPFYGTICLYHTEKKEKVSEDFHFQYLPLSWDGESTSPELRAIFTVEREAAALCLLVQVERAVTEESINGVKGSVYTRKDPPVLTEREASRLSEWAQSMPFREAFAFATIPLFDSAGTAGFGSSSTGGGTPGVLGGAAGGGAGEGAGGPGTPGSSSGALGEGGGVCAADPKRKVHKPVRMSMQVEVERLPGSTALSHSAQGGPAGTSTPYSQAMGHTRSMESMGSEADEVGGLSRTFSISRLLNGFHALDFTDMTRAEPFTHLEHLAFVYPHSVTLPKKLNLFMRLELRDDDTDLQSSRPQLEAIFPWEREHAMQRVASSQVAMGMRPSLFHDEFKIQLPAVLRPSHHLLFSFFHIDLAVKADRPKPVVVGYSVMPLSAVTQSFKGEMNLPMSKELLPKYLHESTKAKLTYWEEGKPVFRLRTRLFSSLLPLSDRLRDFFRQYDRHVLEAPLPREDLLESINGLKGVDTVVLLQFLYPLLNMLLCMIGNGVETLQVAAFRATVNIVSRVQAELSPNVPRNRFLVHFVDFVFDDLGRQQPPVYPGLSNVWRSLARSKSRGFRVGPVYSEALSMAWFVLELVVKSMDLELAQVPQGDEIARLRLEDEVFLCIRQLFECLLVEVQDKADSDYPLARRLTNSLAFFCYDLITVVDPPQVFELVGLFLSQLAGMCPANQHSLKLHFLRILCDHDLFVETPGRGPTEKNYLSTVLVKDLFTGLNHDDPNQRATASRMLTFLLAKHEYDARYQQADLKLYISQLYFPIVTQLLDEPRVFTRLGVLQKRQVVVAVLAVLRHVDSETLLKAWKHSAARTELFFSLLQESLFLFQYTGRTGVSTGELGAVVRNHHSLDGKGRKGGSEGELPPFPLYSDRISLSANDSLDSMALADSKGSGEREQLVRKYSGVSSTAAPPQTPVRPPVPLREELRRARVAPLEAMTILRQGLPPVASERLAMWEATMAGWVSLQVLEVLEQFSDLAAEGAVVTDYDTMDCLTGPISALLSMPQPVSFWEVFVPAFAEMLRLHGRAMLASSKANDARLKDMFGNLLKRLIVKPEFVRKRALLCLLLLLRTALLHMGNVHHLRVILTVALSEVMMQLRLLQRGARPGEITESLEVERLRFSLEELGSEETWFGLLAESGLPDMCLEIMVGDEEADEEDEDDEEEEEDEDEDEEDYDEEEDEEVEFDDLDDYYIPPVQANTWESQPLNAPFRVPRTVPVSVPIQMEGLKTSNDCYAMVAQAYRHVLNATPHSPLLCSHPTRPTHTHPMQMEGLKTSNDQYTIGESCYIWAQAYGYMLKATAQSPLPCSHPPRATHPTQMEGLRTSNDRYAIVESYYILAQAYGHMEGLKTSNDRYAIVESYYILAQAYGHVPDLYIMWMLHLCEAHQEMSQWAEAAQCAVSVAGVVIRGLHASTTRECAWEAEHLELLWRVCPLARHQWRARPSRPSARPRLPNSASKGAGGSAGAAAAGGGGESDFGATCLNTDSAVKYLQMASSFFAKAELFHFCAEMLSLTIPVFRFRRDFYQLSKCHTSLAGIYDNVLAQEQNPIPFKDATYYRVGFYGERFGYIDGREFIYREPREVRLGDIMEKLKSLYDAREPDEEPLHVIQDSRQVDPAALKPGFVYMQITAVEPVVGIGDDRWLGRTIDPAVAGAPVFNCFFFDTPFTPNGKQHGRMEDQWKRRTLVYTQSTLPSLISRQPVVRSEVREYSPLQCAVEIIENRSHALEMEMASQLGAGGGAGGGMGGAGGGRVPQDPAAVTALIAAAATASGSLRLPRIQTLQRLLQGSVALQVNSGVLGVCMAFYEANPHGLEPRPKDPLKLQSPSGVETLTDAIVRFVVVCKRAVAVHGRAVTEVDRDFQEQLERSMEELEREISPFIPVLRK
ncbi:unnamed protein product [Closterium sp. Yama58-4]|nr:unnamed protein product [Closterium sp. Yama58-4]